MARLTDPTASIPTRLAVVADPHVSTRATGSPKQFERTESLLESTIEDINTRGVDAVVSVGDLTKDGAPWDFDRFDELIEALDAPFFAVPGNHDVPKTFDDHPTTSRGRFVDRYTPGSLPYHVRVGGVDLFGLDSAWTPEGDLRDSHDGRITTEQLEWLGSRSADADCPIAFTHHNLPPTATQADAYGEATGIDMSGVPVMRNGPEVMTALEAADIPLVLTGHIHLPGVGTHEESKPTATAESTETTGSAVRAEPEGEPATPDGGAAIEAQTPAEPTVTEVTSPALCTFPQAYLLIDIDSRGTTVRYVSISSVEESIAAYDARLSGTDIDRGQAALASIRTAQFPLVEAWLPEHPKTPTSPMTPLSGPSMDG